MHAKDLINRATKLDNHTFEKMMIEFAKYHVSEALKSVVEKHQLKIINEEDNTERYLPNKSYRLTDTKKVVLHHVSVFCAYDLDDIG